MIKRKSLTTVLLSLVALLCFAFGSVGFINTNSAQASGNPDYVSSFRMLEGAEIRTAEPNGIRFTTEISAEQYNALTEKIGTEYKNVEFGALVCPTDLIPAGGLTMANAEVENSNVKIVRRTTWDVEFNPELETDVYQYNTDIIDIKPENLTKEFQALGYVTIFPYEGDAVTYYATVTNNGNVRTPFGVATTLISRGSNNAYILGIVDSVMEGKTLTLSQTSATVELGEEKALALTATVDGVEVPVEYSVTDTSIATCADGKVNGLKVGSTQIVATLKGAEQNYIASLTLNVSVDVSRFEGKNSVSMNDLSGNYNFTQTAYYESGVGVWMYGVVTHSVKNWNVSFCPTVGGVTFGVHSGGENLLPGERKSFENAKMWTVSNPNGSYTTSFVGLAKESDLGIKVTADLVEVTPIFENGGNIQVHVQAGTVGTSWWQMPNELVDKNGFLDGGDAVKSVQFTDTTTKKMFSYSAKLTEYGLFFDAEVRTNGASNANLIFVYAKDYNGGYGEFYLGANAGSDATWKSVRGLQAGDATAFGFTTQIYYRAFYSWSYLQAKGLVDYNSANPIESTVYLKVLFESGSDTMSYKRTLNESVSVNDNTVETAYWGCYQGWVGITNTKRCDHITKNGIIN